VLGVWVAAGAEIVLELLDLDPRRGEGDILDATDSGEALAPGAALAHGRRKAPDAAARAGDKAQAGLGGIAEHNALGAGLAGLGEGIPHEAAGQYSRHWLDSFRGWVLTRQADPSGRRFGSYGVAYRRVLLRNFKGL
jgi:hypothetical protein